MRVPEAEAEAVEDEGEVAEGAIILLVDEEDEAGVEEMLEELTLSTPSAMRQNHHNRVLCPISRRPQMHSKVATPTRRPRSASFAPAPSPTTP